MDLTSLFDIKDKIVLVTGGSRGIGLMIAEGFVKNGAKVYISSRNAKICDEVAEQLAAQGTGKAVSLPADLQSLEECKRLIDEIMKREGRLHVLVNNAGATWGAPFEKHPEEAFEKVLNLNLKRIFSLTKAALPLLEKAATPEDPARVINIGSIDGERIPPVENYAYAVSKTGLHHLTRLMAGNLSGRNITFNSVAPGPFKSKMTKKMLENSGPEIIAAVPLNRIGSQEDVAGTCIYLSSRAGAYTNGATIALDGGMLCRPFKL